MYNDKSEMNYYYRHCRRVNRVLSRRKLVAKLVKAPKRIPSPLGAWIRTPLCLAIGFYIRSIQLKLIPLTQTLAHLIQLKVYQLYTNTNIYRFIYTKFNKYIFMAELVKMDYIFLVKYEKERNINIKCGIWSSQGL